MYELAVIFCENIEIFFNSVNFILFVSRTVRNDGWVMTITDYFKYSQRICSEYTTIWMPRSHPTHDNDIGVCVLAEQR